MRTTVDIPDHLMKKAKIKAVQEGITLKKMLINCLEKELSAPTGKKEAPWRALRGEGSADSPNPEVSGFDGYAGPDWYHASQVNDPDT